MKWRSYLGVSIAVFSVTMCEVEAKHSNWKPHIGVTTTADTELVCPDYRYVCPDCPEGQECIYPNSGGCEGAGIPICRSTNCQGIRCLIKATPCPDECPFSCLYDGPGCCPFLGNPVCQPPCNTLVPCAVTACPIECPNDCTYPDADFCCPMSGEAVCRDPPSLPSSDDSCNMHKKHHGNKEHNMKDKAAKKVYKEHGSKNYLSDDSMMKNNDYAGSGGHHQGNSDYCEDKTVTTTSTEYTTVTTPASSTTDPITCILIIIPCPEECPDTCVYPMDHPCPFTQQPTCPVDNGSSSITIFTTPIFTINPVTTVSIVTRTTSMPDLPTESCPIPIPECPDECPYDCLQYPHACPVLEPYCPSITPTPTFTFSPCDIVYPCPEECPDSCVYQQEYECPYEHPICPTTQPATISMHHNPSIHYYPSTRVSSMTTSSYPSVTISTYPAVLPCPLIKYACPQECPDNCLFRDKTPCPTAVTYCKPSTSTIFTTSPEPTTYPPVTTIFTTPSLGPDDCHIPSTTSSACPQYTFSCPLCLPGYTCVQATTGICPNTNIPYCSSATVTTSSQILPTATDFSITFIASGFNNIKEGSVVFAAP